MIKRMQTPLLLIAVLVGVLMLPGCSQPEAPTESLPAEEPSAESTQPEATTEDVTELKIEDLKEGEGDPVKTGQTAVVHYTGWLTDGTKFDSSKDRGQPFAFRLGENKVIAGWEQGVEGMKVGGVRKLTIPPDLGYGPDGTPDGSIPPMATLVFEVELLEIQ